jgi:uncharacterized Zn finger protein (UPF0148 family)
MSHEIETRIECPSCGLPIVAEDGCAECGWEDRDPEAIRDDIADRKFHELRDEGLL